MPFRETEDNRSPLADLPQSVRDRMGLDDSWATGAK